MLASGQPVQRNIMRIRRKLFWAPSFWSILGSTAQTWWVVAPPWSTLSHAPWPSSRGGGRSRLHHRPTNCRAYGRLRPTHRQTESFVAGLKSMHKYYLRSGKRLITRRGGVWQHYHPGNGTHWPSRVTEVPCVTRCVDAPRPP